jgi:hypothetical protein
MTVEAAVLAFAALVVILSVGVLWSIFASDYLVPWVMRWRAYRDERNGRGG